MKEKLVPITVTVSPKIKARLKKRAIDEGTNLMQIARILLERYLSEEGKEGVKDER